MAKGVRVMWKRKPAQIVNCIYHELGLFVTPCFYCLGRCRGCRNPHIPGGKKLRFFLSDVGDSTSNTSESSLITPLNLPSYAEQMTSVYSACPQMSFEKVPSTLLVDDERSSSGRSENLDIDM